MPTFVACKIREVVVNVPNGTVNPYTGESNYYQEVQKRFTPHTLDELKILFKEKPEAFIEVTEEHAHNVLRMQTAYQEVDMSVINPPTPTTLTLKGTTHGHTKAGK